MNSRRLLIRSPRRRARVTDGGTVGGRHQGSSQATDEECAARRPEPARMRPCRQRHRLHARTRHGLPDSIDRLRRRQQPAHWRCLHRHGGIGLAIRRHCADPRRRRVRSRVAQRQHRRIRSLRHRQQSDHRRREPRPGRIGLAARRFRRRFACRKRFSRHRITRNRAWR
jgi:hypothetical protein